MDIQAFLIEVSHLVFGAFATFCAILLWSRTRDLSWTFVIVGVIVFYAGIVWQTLVRFGILEEQYFSIQGVPVVQIVLTDLPLFFIAIGFLIALGKKKAL